MMTHDIWSGVHEGEPREEVHIAQIVNCSRVFQITPEKKMSDILHCRYRWLWLPLLLLLFISDFPFPPIGTCVGCRLFLLHWPNDIKSKKESIRYLNHIDNHTIA
jgi:hypothetical protein